MKRIKEQIKILVNLRASWGTFESFKAKNAKHYDQLKIMIIEMEEILKNNLNYETEEALLTGKCSNEEIVF
jgi:hypothetical protein